MTTLLQKARGLFPGQQPTERIYLATRPHWVALLKEIAVWLLFAALPIVFDAWILPEFEFHVFGGGAFFDLDFVLS